MVDDVCFSDTVVKLPDPPLKSKEWQSNPYSRQTLGKSVQVSVTDKSNPSDFSMSFARRWQGRCFVKPSSLGIKYMFFVITSLLYYLKNMFGKLQFIEVAKTFLKEEWHYHKKGGNL